MKDKKIVKIIGGIVIVAIVGLGVAFFVVKKTGLVNPQNSIDHYKASEFYNGVDYKFVVKPKTSNFFSDGYVSYNIKDLKIDKDKMSLTLGIIADKYDVSKGIVPEISGLKSNFNSSSYSLKKGTMFYIKYEGKLSKELKLKIGDKTFKFAVNTK